MKIVPLVVSGLLFTSGAGAGPSKDKKQELALDLLEFSVATNVPAFKFTGKAESFLGSAERGDAGISGVHFLVPVKGLSTHMSLRDEHMRDRIFKAGDGSFPDIVFDSTRVSCASGATAGACEVVGTLQVAGKKSQQTFSFVQADPRTAEGELKLDLQAMGIEAPSHLGVKVKPEIPVKFKVHVTH